MADSLQDQLRALGLARNKPVARRQQNSKTPGRAKQKPAAKSREQTAELSLEQAYALKKRDERKTVEDARRKKQAEDRKRRQLNKEIRKIVDANRLNDKQAEISRNFMFRGRIRKLHVTPEQLKALNQHELGIAYLSGGYHLLAKEHLEAVRLLSTEHVVDLENESDDDGDYPVPDDISW
jgi:uncharacterized protein YaiL (DUF2058 family)